MRAVLTALTLWLGTTAAIVGGILWSTRMETLAELPDTTTGHAGIADLSAADCEWCLRADDAGALVWFDVDKWEAELRETAS
jgi:hypothetical protein